MKKGVTIFTPTYNRCTTLPRLYDSLKKQKNKDFEWLIVDDGSIDDTKKIVDEFIKEKKIKIRYIYYFIVLILMIILVIIRLNKF